MGVAPKIVPVPTMLTTDTDDNTVESELTDPLATWSENIAKVASKWNPCVSDANEKPSSASHSSDTQTESETETEYETESEDSSDGNSSESDDRDEERIRRRQQPSLRTKKTKGMRPLRDNDDDTTIFDPVQVIFDFVGWLLETTAATTTKGTEGWSNMLAVSDAELLHDDVTDEDPTSKRIPKELVKNTSHLDINETLSESGCHLDPEIGELQPDHVVVATEALALGDFNADSAAIPKMIRNSFVGTIHHSGPEAKVIGLKHGMRVASIAQCEFNSKYVSVPVENLYVVPKALDAAEMAVLFAYYLPAFEALHHGRTRPYRFSRNCLKGRKILVTGGNQLEAQAVLRLARLAGATDLFMTAPLDYHSVLGKIEGVKLLEDFPKDEWLSVVRGKMDLVIHYEFPTSLKSVRKAMARKGRLVCVQNKKKPLLNSVFEQFRVSSVKRASLFDYSENLKMGLEEVHEDVKFLLEQLSQRNIRPAIDRFIDLSDVPSTTEKIIGTPLTGAVVCEIRKK